MAGTKVSVGYLSRQGIASMDAVSRFISEVIDEQIRAEFMLRSVKGLETGLAMLRNGDLDYLMTMDEASVEEKLNDMPSTSVERVWEVAIPSSYVIASESAMTLDEIRAILVDDVAMRRAGDSIRDILAGRQLVRYGCEDGDEAARRLREQPDAYMEGTAVVCSTRACSGAGLRQLAQPFVNDGDEGVKFVVLSLT